MKTLSTFDTIKALISAGNNVRVTNERCESVNAEAALEKEFCSPDGRTWIISSAKEPIDVREKRAGRVFALAAYEVGTDSRRTGRSMHATMTPVRLANIFYCEMRRALEAAELAR